MSKRNHYYLRLLMIGFVLVFLFSVSAEQSAVKTIKVKRLKTDKDLEFVKVMDLVKYSSIFQDPMNMSFFTVVKELIPKTETKIVWVNSYSNEAEPHWEGTFESLETSDYLSGDSFGWFNYPYLYTFFKRINQKNNNESIDVHILEIGFDDYDFEPGFPELVATKTLKKYSNPKEWTLYSYLFDGTWTYIPDEMKYRTGYASFSMFYDSYDQIETVVRAWKCDIFGSMTGSSSVKNKINYELDGVGEGDIVTEVDLQMRLPTYWMLSLGLSRTSEENKSWKSRLSAWFLSIGENQSLSITAKEVIEPIIMAETDEPIYGAFHGLERIPPLQEGDPSYLFYQEFSINKKYKRGDLDYFNIKYKLQEVDEDGLPKGDPIQMNGPKWKHTLNLDPNRPLSMQDIIISDFAPLDDGRYIFLQLRSLVRGSSGSSARESYDQAVSDEPDKAEDVFRASEYLHKENLIGQPIIPTLVNTTGTAGLKNTEVEANVLQLNPKTKKIKLLAKLKVKGREGDFLWNPKILINGDRAFFYYQVYKMNGTQQGYLAWIPLKQIVN